MYIQLKKLTSVIFKLNMQLELQERYPLSLFFTASQFPSPFVQFFMIKTLQFLLLLFHLLMVCQDARLPFGTKEGDVLVLFEKWPISEPTLEIMKTV